MICFDNDFKRRLTRLITDSHNKARRHKEVELPSTEDIKKLLTHLLKVRSQSYIQLKHEFSREAYMTLLKACLTSLQVFNRRRPGETERILLEDYKPMRQLNCGDDKDFRSAPEELKSIAKEYSMFSSRGKLRREVKYLVPRDLRVCLDLIIETRPKMKFPSQNEYLFGTRATVKRKINFLKGVNLLS